MKLPFEYVSREVDKLYDQVIDQSDIDGINKHCLFILDFIHACGWREDDLLNQMYPTFNSKLSQNEFNKMN